MGIWNTIFAFAADAFKGSADAKREDKQMAEERAFLREAAARQRVQDLQDRQYKEDGVSNYRQFYTGAPVTNPTRTDPQAAINEENTISMAKPVAPPTKGKTLFRPRGA